MLRRYPNLLKFILLTVFLFVPFLLRFINPKLELYPAVLFPAGASIVSTSDTLLTFSRYELFGIDSLTKNKKRLNPKQFFHPIPMHFWTRMASYNFGLDSLQVRSVDIRRLNLHFRDERFFSSTQLKHTKHWLGTKLLEQSCYDSVFYLINSEVLFNQSDEKIDSSIIISEKSIRLY